MPPSPNDKALIFISTETDEEKVTASPNCSAKSAHGGDLPEPRCQEGDRVLIYMPMIAEACFAMLACNRIGAIHSVVFGGFASGSLAPASTTPSRR
jgi:propionyl-CoA synthetase